MKKKNNHIRTFLITSIILLLPFVFFGLRKIYIVVVLVGLNGLIALAKRKTMISTYLSNSTFSRHVSRAVEFTTFGAVYAGTHYGPVPGLLAGALGMVATYIFEARLSKFSPVTIPLYASIGYMSSYLHMPFINLGIVMAFYYNAINIILLSVLYKAKISKTISFAAVNLVFNAYLFMTLGKYFT